MALDDFLYLRCRLRQHGCGQHFKEPMVQGTANPQPQIKILIGHNGDAQIIMVVHIHVFCSNEPLHVNAGAFAGFQGCHSLLRGIVILFHHIIRQTSHHGQLAFQISSHGHGTFRAFIFQGKLYNR